MGSSYKHLLLILIVTLSACSWARFVEPQAQASTVHPVAVQESSAVAVIVKAQKANLRDSPSRSGNVASTLSHGDLLSLLKPVPTGPWYRVRDSRIGVEGWIHGNTIALLRTSGSSTQAQKPRTTTSTSGRSYVNVDGVRVPSPVFTDKKPTGATARCRDGAYSFSRHRRGTCSYHGGVAEWY
jgi:hypothetical protein